MIILTGVFCLLAIPGIACFWDSDTLREEVAGTDIADLITGRFPRNPARYYEMRLARVAAELKVDPTRLEMYDDAGVACDRLGRHDEAIAWMGRKRKQLDSQKDDAHEYRYHANLGTMYMHKWFGEGQVLDQIALVESARDHIAQAIDINPKAHFGREKYQLMAIEWVLEIAGGTLDVEIDGSDTFLGWGIEGSKASHGTAGNDIVLEVIEGVSGLIRLGAAWESVDVFEALKLSLWDNRQSSVAYLAHLRIAELKTTGHKTLLQSEKGSAGNYRNFEGAGPLHAPTMARLRMYYQQARKHANKWHVRRTAYMNKQFDSGLHPDTHETFWDTYKEKPSLKQPNFAWTWETIVLGNLVLFVFLITLLVVGIRRMKKKVLLR